MKEYNPRQELRDGVAELHATAMLATQSYEKLVNDPLATEEMLIEARKDMDAIMADIMEVQTMLGDVQQAVKRRKN